MQKWEYLTTFLEASVDNQSNSLFSELVDTKNLPRYSPLRLMPELNQLGEKGWELVHMQPVFVGSNEDVLLHEGGGMKRWTSRYFCVFKRLA